MKKGNYITLFVAILAICAIAAFFIHAEKYVGDKVEEPTNSCSHDNVVNCICVDCDAIVHQYLSDDNATCTEPGTSSCVFCGAKGVVNPLGHEAEIKTLESCMDIAYCIRCGIPMKSGPCYDPDGDGWCNVYPDNNHQVN